MSTTQDPKFQLLTDPGEERWANQQSDKLDKTRNGKRYLNK
jgi:hypothetical protein